MSRITHDICDSLGIPHRHFIGAMNMKNTKRIVLAGGSGYLGGLLKRHFARNGCEVVVLTRGAQAGVSNDSSRHCQWDGRTIGEWAKELDGADAVVNLSGRSVNCRYNAANRREIMDSRVDSTRVIGEAIARCEEPPRVWLNFSTATIYKHTYGAAWDERGLIESAPEAKDKFSVEVAFAWEAALAAAKVSNTRKVALRSAIVFGSEPTPNNAYLVMRRLARFGLGGKMGDGRQYVSWVHELDACRAIEFLIEHDDIAGPVNLVAPNPLTNSEMMSCLRKQMGMPIGLPATEWMLEVGAFFLRTETELILKSRRVIPGRLMEAGFRFRFEHFKDAIADLELRLHGVR